MNQTLREQYNQRVGADVLDELFNAITLVRRLITVITYIAMGVSYWHQKEFFAHLGAGLFAWVLPLTLDALMIALIKISQLKGIPEASRRRARQLLAVPALASMAINFMADGHIVLRLFFVFVVLAIMVGDYAHSLIKPDFSEIEKAAVEHAPPVTEADPAEEARKAERRDRDRQRRTAKRLAAEQAAIDEAARREAERERRRLRRAELAAQRAATPEPLVVPAQPVHVVVPTRPRTGAFGLPRQPLGERVSVLSKPAA